MDPLGDPHQDHAVLRNMRFSIQGIVPAMSANEILQRFPQTEPIFTQLQVNRLREGYESVDELAWRHGIDVSQVLEQLREAVGSS